jgi:tripartite-type tricarboxylate transporter receptor subunit TctC
MASGAITRDRRCGASRDRGPSSRLILSAQLGLLAVSTAVLAAPDFPTRPIRVVVAGAVGSGTDILARQVGSKLTEAWGQPIVIDPRVGASGLIGAELVAKSAADGYTLWMATMSQLISTTLFQRLLLAREFEPVSLVATTPYLIAVNASLPVNSIAELIAYSKAKPKQVLYGSAGQGTNMHLCMEMFRAMAGIDLFHVPYKGTTMALNDLIGGQVQVICASAPTLQPFVRGGRLRILGVTSRARTVLAPDLPPIAESVPGFELVGWYGLLAPLGTPKEIVSRINSAVVKALKTPEAQERFAAQGAEVAGSSPAEFGDFLRKESVKWGKVLRDANIRSAE